MYTYWQSENALFFFSEQYNVQSFEKVLQTVCVCVCSVAQSYLTLCNPMECTPPGSSVHGISQARILKWVAIPFSSVSS